MGGGGGGIYCLNWGLRDSSLSKSLSFSEKNGGREGGLV